MEKKILKIINEITDEQYSQDQILNENFENTKMMDSLQIVELVMGLEDDFGIEIEDDDLSIENLNSFSAITSLIKRLTSLS